MPRTSAQRYFLTYSQVDDNDFTSDSLADFLFGLDPEPLFVETIQESHENQGRHFHAVLCFRQRFQRETTIFDFLGRSADIKGIRNGGVDLYNRRHYIRKGDIAKADEHTPASHKSIECDYSAEPTVRGVPPTYSSGVPAKPSWGDIVNDSATEEEFLDRVRSDFPREWVLRHDQIVSYATKWYHRAPPFAPQFPEESFVIPDEIDTWVQECIDKVSTVAGTHF